MRHPRVVLTTSILLVAILLLQEPLRQTVFAILRLPLTVLSRTAGALGRLSVLPSVLEERDRLREEVLRQRLELARLTEALRHAERLGALEEAAGAPGGLIARVIDRSRLPTQQTLVIDRGGEDGVVAGSIVLDVDGMVGRVLEAAPTSAVVVLLTDPGSRVAGMVERTRHTGLLVGKARGRCQLVYLDEDADITAGDRIVTAGLGGSIPKGLPLGTVSEVVRDAERGTAWAWVRPTAQLGRLEEVLCLPQ